MIQKIYIFRLLLFITFAPGMGLFSACGQTITTAAGNGIGGYTGDGSAANQAEINQPDDIAFDSFGNYYIADAGNCVIRKVTAATGVISTYAGSSTLGGYTGDGGPATLATFFYPSGIAVDSNNNLFIADYYNDVIREVNAATGIITTVVGTSTPGFSGDGGAALSAEIDSPIGIRFDVQNNLYIADSGNNAVRLYSETTGIITTVAGTGTPGYTGDGGAAVSAQLNGCEMVDPDNLGNFYISDFNNWVIRKVSIATGVISTFAGTGTPGYTGDGGTALLADFFFDNGTMAFGCGGNLFMTDDMNNVVREVGIPSGTVTTMAGTGAAGYFGDGGPAALAQFNHTESLAFDGTGDLYVVDYGNSVVRKITGLCGPTSTPTSTATFTSTQTPTETPTASYSPTLTPSPTVTLTFTSTFTSTATLTVTMTQTLTFSPTQTPTPSPTVTYTVTPTATPWTSLGKTASPGSASSGDMITYTLSVTLNGGTLDNAQVTDNLPPDEIFISLSPPASGTATFSTSSSQLVWNLPPTLPPGVYGLSYQAQINSFVPGQSQIVNTALLSSSSLGMPLSAAATVAVTGGYTVEAGVYNEAGELICGLWTRKYSQSVLSLDLAGGPITTLKGTQNQIILYSGGVSLGFWKGLDGSGNPVVNGTYYIVIKNTDPLGVVTTVTRQAMVNRPILRVDASVFNEAGELVKHLSGWTEDPTGSQLTGVLLSQSAFQPGASGPASEVQMTIQTSGTAVTLTWNGTSDSGPYVSPGNYILSVHWDQGTGATEDITRIVQVTAGETNQHWTLSACPNFLSSSDGFKTAFKFSSLQPYTLRVQIYDIAGERVATIKEDPGSQQTLWNASGMASGYYIAVVDVINSNGAVTFRQKLKIVISR